MSGSLPPARCAAVTAVGTHLHLTLATPQHCEAAQEMMATVARALTETGESVTFGRVACDSPQTRALSKAAHVAAFPLVTLHRGGTKLLELTQSMRGGDEAAARRLQEVVASVAAETRSPRDVHFRMLAGAVQVVDGPAPEEPPRFDYAAMRCDCCVWRLPVRVLPTTPFFFLCICRAAAQAQLAQSKEGSDGDDECDSPEDAEECGVKW